MKHFLASHFINSELSFWHYTPHITHVVVILWFTFLEAIEGSAVKLDDPRAFYDLQFLR